MIRNQRRGFTLVEILVSITILLMAFTALLALLQVTMDTVRKGRARADVESVSRIALDTITRDLEGMFQLAEHGMRPVFIGESDRLIFTTITENSGKSDISCIAYYRQRDPGDHFTAPGFRNAAGEISPLFFHPSTRLIRLVLSDCDSLPDLRNCGLESGILQTDLPFNALNDVRNAVTPEMLNAFFGTEPSLGFTAFECFNLQLATRGAPLPFGIREEDFQVASGLVDPITILGDGLDNDADGFIDETGEDVLAGTAVFSILPAFRFEYADVDSQGQLSHPSRGIKVSGNFRDDDNDGFVDEFRENQPAGAGFADTRNNDEDDYTNEPGELEPFEAAGNTDFDRLTDEFGETRQEFGATDRWWSLPPDPALGDNQNLVRFGRIPQMIKITLSLVDGENLDRLLISEIPFDPTTFDLIPLPIQGFTRIIQGVNPQGIPRVTEEPAFRINPTGLSDYKIFSTTVYLRMAPESIPTIIQ